MKTDLRPVTRANPCPLCEGTHKCSRGTDGLFVCGRCSGEVAGFICLGKAQGNEQFTLYRKVGDPLLDQNDYRRPAGKPPSSNGHGTKASPAANGKAKAATDWEELVKEHQARFNAAAMQKLAEALGLPEWVLAELPIGVGDDHDGRYWAFPEVDAAGKVIGVGRRYPNGEKRTMAGSKRGLTMAARWDSFEAGRILWLVEGSSDVLAARAMGLPVLGRPSNVGGVELIAELLGRLTPDLQPMLAVLGEFDPKCDGKWPGRDGAVQTAAKLKELLGEKWVIRWALPPAGHKDLRAWALAQQLPPDRPDAWAEAGVRFADAVREKLLDPPASEAECYRFEAIDSPTFFTTDYKLEWLVKRLLVKGQPGVFGGPKKALKTTTLMDLAISLATATPFLGHFEVYRPRRVVMISGESGEAVLQETGRRICAARGIDPTTLDVHWSFRLPQVANPLDRAALEAGLKELGAEVVIIDPLYLCLLAGVEAKDIEAGNLFHMGPLLLSLARACLNVGCTPLLCHHARKNLAHPFEPMELEDLSFAGIQEFARQWILESRREPFDPDTGSSRLWLSAGGSAGQSGLWALDVEEGVLDDDFGGRTWEVVVRKASEERATQAELGDSKKQQNQSRLDKADDAKVLVALDKWEEKAARAAKSAKPKKGKAKKEQPAAAPAKLPTVNDLHVHAHLSHARTKRALERLEDAGLIDEVEIVIHTGRNNKVERCVNGYRRRGTATEPTEPTVNRQSAE